MFDEELKRGTRNEKDPPESLQIERPWRSAAPMGFGGIRKPGKNDVIKDLAGPVLTAALVSVQAEVLPITFTAGTLCAYRPVQFGTGEVEAIKGNYPHRFGSLLNVR